jgi:hypothetical protein
MADDSGGGAPQSATEVKEQAQEKVSGLADRAQSTAREQVDQRSTQAGEQVTSLASDLRSVGEQLRSQDNTNSAKVAEQVAERAERAGGYLTESDADRILGDIEDLGRRQPLLVLAGGVVLGLAAARFLKASSTSRYESRSTQASQGTQTRAYSPAPTASLQGQEVGGEAVGAAVPPPEAPAPAVAGTPST